MKKPLGTPPPSIRRRARNDAQKVPGLTRSQISWKLQTYAKANGIGLGRKKLKRILDVAMGLDVVGSPIDWESLGLDAGSVEAILSGLPTLGKKR